MKNIIEDKSATELANDLQERFKEIEQFHYEYVVDYDTNKLKSSKLFNQILSFACEDYFCRLEDKIPMMISFASELDSDEFENESEQEDTHQAFDNEYEDVEIYIESYEDNMIKIEEEISESKKQVA